MKTGKPKSYDISNIIRAREMLDKEPARRITITALSLEVEINPIKLQEGFRYLFNQTIHQYRLDLRLHLAKRFLEDTDLTVAEISYKVGFNNPDVFTRAFRKKFHQTPSGWRKTQEAQFRRYMSIKSQQTY